VTARRVWIATCIAVSLGAFATARADRLHLEGGGTIEVEAWWVDGETLRYTGPAGTVGIPRSLVIRIEESAETPDAGVDAAEPPRRDPPANVRTAPTPPPPWPTSETREVAGMRQVMDEAVAALKAREFSRASDLFYRVLETNGGVNAARVGYALSELALGRDERALPVVLDGLAQEPSNADLHELLGDIRNREERVDDAIRSWNDAFALAPNDRLREKILMGERELNAGRNYDFTTTAHFNVRHDGDLSPALADEVVDHLEQRYRDLSARFRHAPPQAITVVLYPDREFRDVTLAPDSVAGLYDGKIRVPLGGISKVDERARRLLDHELTHAVVHSKTRSNCPRWLHEGLAQLIEGRQVTRADVSRIRGLLASSPAAWDSHGFSYPAALSLTEYLESRRGFGGILDLLEALAEGLDIDGALRNTFGNSYDEICRSWAQSLADPRG
jgi:tetratricopeptide (TPR) repeat protein